jgi:archaellum component FlaC
MGKISQDTISEIQEALRELHDGFDDLGSSLSEVDFDASNLAADLPSSYDVEPDSVIDDVPEDTLASIRYDLENIQRAIGDAENEVDNILGTLEDLETAMEQARDEADAENEFAVGDIVTDGYYKYVVIATLDTDLGQALWAGLTDFATMNSDREIVYLIGKPQNLMANRVQAAD